MIDLVVNRLLLVINFIVDKFLQVIFLYCDIWVNNLGLIITEEGGPFELLSC